MGRNTDNRDALLDAARSFGRAFSVRELHDAVRPDRPGMGLTTVYRAVERWRGEQRAEQAGVRDGEAVFVLCDHTGHHHHIVCVECGAEAVIDLCPLDALRDSVSQAGFELAEGALRSIPARCGRCSS
jgi:Fe2+ or Zn2+ uptake regulation protein